MTRKVQRNPVLADAAAMLRKETRRISTPAVMKWAAKQRHGRLTFVQRGGIDMGVFLYRAQPIWRRLKVTNGRREGFLVI